MRNIPAARALLVLAATLGCVHHAAPVHATTTAPVGSPNARWITKTPPPAPYTESPPPKPHPADVWVAGYFKWDGRDFEWVPGHWMAPPPGTRDWVPGAWSERADGKWEFVDGHWQ
jgi:WXXGXW repeat (2 copies)